MVLPSAYNTTTYTSLPGCETGVIRAPIVARLFRISPPAHGMFYRAHCGDHDWLGATNASHPVPEKIPQSGDFSRQLQWLVAAPSAIAPPRDACPGTYESPSTRMRIRATNRASFRPMTAKIRSARLRRGYLVLRTMKAQSTMVSRAGCHHMDASVQAECGVCGRVKANFSCVLAASDMCLSV